MRRRHRIPRPGGPVLFFAAAAIAAACSLIPLDYRTETPPADGGTTTDAAGGAAAAGGAGTGGAGGTMSSAGGAMSGPGGGGGFCSVATNASLSAACSNCLKTQTALGAPCNCQNSVACATIVSCVVNGLITPRFCSSISGTGAVIDALAMLQCAQSVCSSNSGPCSTAYFADCFDTIKDDAETGSDCGGPLCLVCPLGQPCDTACDCVNKAECVPMGGGTICCRMEDGGLLCHP